MSSSGAARRSRSSIRWWPGIDWPRSPAATSARASRSPSRAGCRRGRGTTTRGARHWKTEIVASHVEMLSGRKKKDYEAQQAADSLVVAGRRARRGAGDRADRRGVVRSGDVRRRRGRARGRGGRRSGGLTHRTSRGGGATPSAPSPSRTATREVPTGIRRTRPPGSRRREAAAAPSSQFVSPSRAIRQLIPTAAATAAISSGVKTRFIGCADQHAEQDEDRRHEQRHLEARAEGDGHRELHLVLGRELDRRPGARRGCRWSG